MKAEFFAVAVLVLLGGVYAVYATHDIRCLHRSDFTMTISSDGDFEQIKHSGLLRINADGTGIDSISTGGYFSYERNGRRIKVACDAPGILQYTWVEHGHVRGYDAGGKKFLAEATRELILNGFDTAAGRRP